MISKIRVLLVDDHNIVRSGLRRLLEMGGEIDVVAEASSGEQACSLNSQFPVSVIIMDISMPGIGGIEALRRILISSPNAKVLIISMHDNPIFASQALALGARGYVAKSGLADDLLRAVKEVAAGKTYISTQIAQKIAVNSISGDTNSVQKLSAREFEIFRMLSEGKDVEKVADILSISQKTVANYQTSIKQKLGISNAYEFVRYAIRCGVISDSDST